jgi:hypothetical protein
VTERLPNFIYIGPSKAGSTWLHEVLIRHPQIFMSAAKDLYFFDRYFDRGLPWYASHFRDIRPEQRIVGEVCQEYLSCADAPKRMVTCLGDDVRLMVTLRDPVARAFSGYLYMRKHGVFGGTFREALDSRPGMFNHSRYATLLSQYLEYFDRSSIYTAVFDDLVEDPQAFIDELLRWLGVDPMELGESLLEARLPASKARSVPVARAAKQAANWARQHNAATIVGLVKRSPLVQKALYEPLDDKPELSVDDADYMRENLLPEIIQLDEMLGLDLRSRWGWPA